MPPAGAAQAAGTHRLHQDVVLAVEQVCAGVLVQGLHVLPRRGGEAILRRAAAGVPLADLPGHTARSGRAHTATQPLESAAPVQPGGLQRNHLDS